MTPKPFTIHVDDDVLADLQARLKQTRWIDQVEPGWGMGADTEYMKSLVHYWQHGYDWRKQEADLNKFAQFTAQVDGTDLHFIHEKSDQAHTTPVLLLHGWPDSFYRFHKVIPRLKKQFDVIVPSLPGFGFSGHTALAASDAADVLAKLMTETLGYASFAVAGGDISTQIVQALALNHADVVKVVHLTDAGFPNGSEDFSTMSPAEQQFAGKCQQWWYMEGAYTMEQSTKPQTLGAGLNDSPVGLATWIIEKFYGWTGSPEKLEEHFSKDELLTNVMIYWVTETITSSMRTYLLNTRAMYATGGPKPLQKSTVPAAIAVFPKEGVPMPREWAERSLNVQRFTELARGGHFGALEEPELYAQDVAESVQALAA